MIKPDYRVFPWKHMSGRHDQSAHGAGGTAGGAAIAVKPTSSPAEEKLSTSPISNIRSLNGGVNTTYIGEIDGQKVIVKPESGLNKQKMRGNIPPGKDMQREATAYEVAKRMDIDMPATVIRSDTPKGKAMVQEFVNGTVGCETDSWKSASNLNKIALLDAVIGNEDRHAGNFLVDRSNKIIPIDHGLLFPQSGKTWGNELIIERRIKNGDKALQDSEKKLLRDLLKDKSFTQSITKGISRGVYRYTRDRIEKMLASGEIDTVMNLASGKER